MTGLSRAWRASGALAVTLAVLVLGVCGEGYMGCYKDSRTRILKHMAKSSRDNMTLDVCRTQCDGYTYFGTEYGKECYCGNSLNSPEKHVKVWATDCNFPCSGDRQVFCGGRWRISVFHVPVAPVDATWGAWQTWNKCSVRCQEGQRSRSRACGQDGGRSSYNGGKNCTEIPGNSTETQPCLNWCRDPEPDPDDSWAPWRSCSVTCGHGQRARVRRCHSPCPDQRKETKPCNMSQCTVAGVWSGWSAWSECSASCGGGWTSVTRRCRPPALRQPGEDTWPLSCPGFASVTRACSQGPCPECDRGQEEWNGTPVIGRHPLPCPVKHGWAMCVRGTVPTSGCQRVTVDIYDKEGNIMAHLDQRFHYYKTHYSIATSKWGGHFESEKEMDVFPFRDGEPMALTVRLLNATTLQLVGNRELIGYFTASRPIDAIAEVDVSPRSCALEDISFNLYSACDVHGTG